MMKMSCLSTTKKMASSSILSLCFVVEIGLIFLFPFQSLSSFFSSSTSSSVSSSNFREEAAVWFVSAQLSTIISPQTLASFQKAAAADIFPRRKGKEKKKTDTEEDRNIVDPSVLFSINVLRPHRLLGCDEIKEHLTKTAGQTNAEEAFYLYIGGKVGGCEHQTPRNLVNDLRQILSIPMVGLRSRSGKNTYSERNNVFEDKPSFRLRFFAAETIAALVENGRRVELDWNKLCEDISRVILSEYRNTKKVEKSSSGGSDNVELSFAFLLFSVTLRKIDIEEVDEDKIESVLQRFSQFLSDILDDENTEEGGSLDSSISSEEEKEKVVDSLPPSLRISANVLWAYGTLTSLEKYSEAIGISCDSLVGLIDYVVSYLDQQLTSSSLSSDMAPIICSLYSIFRPFSYSFQPSFPAVDGNAADRNECVDDLFSLIVDGLKANNTRNQVEVNIRFCGVMGKSLSSGGFSVVLAASEWTQQKEIVFRPREKKRGEREENKDDCRYVGLVNVSQSSTAAKHLTAAPSLLNFTVATPNKKKVEVMRSLSTELRLQLTDCDVSVVTGTTKMLVFSLKDEEKTSKKTAVAAARSKTPVVISDRDSLIVDVKVRNIDTGKLAFPQYSSIVLSLKQPKHPVPDDLRVDRAIQLTKLASGRLQLRLPLAKAIERQLSSGYPLLLPISGNYSLDILVGDYRMKRSIRRFLLDVNLKFIMQLKTVAVPSSYAYVSAYLSSFSSVGFSTNSSIFTIVLPSDTNFFPKPLIDHKFDIPQSRPHPLFFSIAFILCTLVPMVGLLIAWRWKVKVNANRLAILMKTSSRRALYHYFFMVLMVGIVAVVLGYFFFYNLVVAVRMLIPMIIISAYVGNCVLCDVKSLRLEEEEVQMKKLK